MEKLDYFKLINKYITSDFTKNIYLTHVTLVTRKALKVAKSLNLSNEQLVFIEEASMLHDIGIVNVNAPDIGCYGEKDYICHIIEGGEILRKEGLPAHAEVAETHTGVGIFKKEIISKKLPLPKRDLIPVTLEQRIISWADLFYSKDADDLFCEKTIDEIRSNLSRYGKKNVEILEEWVNLFT